MTAASARMPIICAGCHTWFVPARAGARYCTGRCRTRQWRARHPGKWALITWYLHKGGGAQGGHHEIRARFKYFTAQAAALAAAPTDEPYTIVDRLVSAPPRPTIEQLLSRHVEVQLES
ncbi:MAG TPA: hypothetical protein VMS84_17570 [Mycobacterium sp.]|nr:hypothetical protein [Mycobacterium sp.]